MKFLTDEKLLIVGAGGMIGSNMAQTAMMLGLTPNICLYDIYEPGVHGVAEEMYHCAFPGANITWTVDPEVAFKDAKYIISSGGAPRKEGMTREDLLKGNCKIAAEFGDFIKKYCPDVKHVVVIFNPADVTALTALIHSGLKPEQLTSLAALDSTRLQEALAAECGVQQCKVTNAYTYGGHGEAMAVFASEALVDGKPLSLTETYEMFGRPVLGGFNRKAEIGKESPEKIAAMTREIIAGGPKGHLMIGADCSVPSPLNITDNIHAAVSAAHGR